MDITGCSLVTLYMIGFLCNAIDILEIVPQFSEFHSNLMLKISVMK